MKSGNVNLWLFFAMKELLGIILRNLSLLPCINIEPFSQSMCPYPKWCAKGKNSSVPDAVESYLRIAVSLLENSKQEQLRHLHILERATVYIFFRNVWIVFPTLFPQALVPTSLM